MSILIRGMDYTPPRKTDRVYLVYHFDDEIGCFSHSICVTDKLIELPPHGRLIDADEFYKSLKKWNVKFYSVYEKDKKDERIAALLELDLLVRKVLANAPTIIPAAEAQGND